jgi:hypothetical protein
MELLMDVVGSCNLRCPSCPVGNIGKINQTGKTDVSVFQDIIAKADDNYAIYRVSLYNWGEPPSASATAAAHKDREGSQPVLCT